jgi:tetratricopeptide (TPR) repeat protein
MLVRALALSCFLLLVPLDLLAQDPPEYTEAVQLLQEQHWSEALERIHRLQQQYPDNPKVGNLEGLALLGRGDPVSAAVAFERVLSEYPKFFPAMKNLAILEWQKEPTRAVEDTRRALEISPRDAILNACVTISDLQSKNTTAAKQHLDIAGGAISAMPPRMEMQLAYLLGTNGLYAESAHVYQDLLAHGGRGAVLTYNLGLAQYLAGDYEGAIHTLEHPEHRPSRDELNLLAQAYEKNRQTQLAIDRLREAITLFPADENNYLDLATICIDHNAYPLGIEIVQLGLQKKPHSEKLLFQLGVLHALSGQFDLAREEFDRTRKLAPGKDLPVAALELADIQQNGRLQTLDELRNNLKKKGDSAILCYLLGSSLIHNGAQPGEPEYAEARTAFRKAIRLDPKLPYPYIELGKMYERSGNLAAAISLFEKAAAFSSRDPSPYYHLARDYQKLNQTQKAAQMVNKLKEIEQHSREFEHEVLTSPKG